MSILQAGTRLMYNPTAGTTPAAQVAGASIPSTWVQILNLVSLDDVRTQECTEFDDSDLENTGPVPNAWYGPGWLTFTKKKNAGTAALRVLAASGAKVSIAVIYADGSIDYALSVRIINTSSGKGTAGDFSHKVPESYKASADGAVIFLDHV